MTKFVWDKSDIRDITFWKNDGLSLFGEYIFKKNIFPQPSYNQKATSYQIFCLCKMKGMPFLIKIAVPLALTLNDELYIIDLFTP